MLSNWAFKFNRIVKILNNTVIVETNNQLKRVHLISHFRLLRDCNSGLQANMLKQNSITQCLIKAMNVQY